MTDETLMIPIEVDSPLNITFHAETGEMTVECFQFVSGVPQAKMIFHYTPQATREMLRALAIFQEKLGTEFLTHSTPHNVQ
ncbi:hypothetical protein BKG93_11235 [Rodentibacter ratti]|uniref:DUF3467 domain-containing protein n=1 Tax=Rodentibacter ratti TaxID=1906745 RepID=A0A1V3KXT7_9PAST|nr:hypothetical protein [Rodentibacter ratti]OOF82506.1 hypothetical protein BKG93_11235 [Rodentibacter ratti]